MRIASPLKPQFAKRVPWLFVFFRTLFRRSGLVSEYFRAEMNVTEPERWPQSRRGPLTAHGFVDGARQAKSALAIRPFL
jgi:hypothetical protein